MERYDFHISYERLKLERSVVIRASASTDDDAIQIAHALADLAQFEDGSLIEIKILGSNQRDVAILSDALDDKAERYIERSAHMGGGYRSAAS